MYKTKNTGPENTGASHLKFNTNCFQKGDIPYLDKGVRDALNEKGLYGAGKRAFSRTVHGLAMAFAGLSIAAHSYESGGQANEALDSSNTFKANILPETLEFSQHTTNAMYLGAIVMVLTKLPMPEKIENNSRKIFLGVTALAVASEALPETVLNTVGLSGDIKELTTTVIAGALGYAIVKAGIAKRLIAKVIKEKSNKHAYTVKP